MTLSRHLKDASSPVRIYMDRVSPVLADTKGHTSRARASAGSLGLVKLATSTPLVPVAAEVDAARTGTAFDIRTRIALGGFEVTTSSAAAGLNQLTLLAEHVENGRHRAQVISEAFAIAELLVQNPSSENDLHIASLVLAHGEQLYRAGLDALKGSFGTACDQASDGRQFVENISAYDLHDLDRLFTVSSEQISSWKRQTDAGIRFETNLSFGGSSLVGGADADWLIGDNLIDCKVYDTLTVSKLRDFLRQLLGYVMLDLDDVLQIRTVGIWLPRQGVMPTWSLEYLLDGDPEVLLPKLREGFINATSEDQLGIYQPTTQRQKDLLLGDNLHTPTRMLVNLARSDDQAIRFMVARNSATPERTVRELAKDKYARVREGVAMNAKVPADILENLHNDKSVVVQRAAAAHPGSVRPVVKPLTSSNESNSSFMVPARPDSIINNIDCGPSESVQIEDQRDDWVLDSRWLLKFLTTILNGNTAANERYLFPNASMFWATHSKRQLEIPERLLKNLPDEIKFDMFRPDRPALVRQVIASSFSVEHRAVRDILLDDPDPEIRWSTLQRSIENPDKTMSNFLARLTASRSERLSFRTDGATPTNRSQRYIASGMDDQMLKVIAAHPATPPASLRVLIETKAPEVLTALAQNPSLLTADRDALIARMKFTRSSQSRSWFARSSDTPPKVLKQLSGSQLVDIRMDVAMNSSTPVDTLTKLSVDPDSSVRTGVLRNPKTPKEVAINIVQSLLTGSVDRELEDLLVSLRERTDLDVPTEKIEQALDRLSKSRLRNPDIRRTVTNDVRTAGNTLSRLANSTDNEIRQEIAHHKRTPTTVLTRLARDADPNVRCAVAGNLNADKQTLLKLSEDEEWRVRCKTASNPRLDDEALRRLLWKDVRRVQLAAFNNPSLNSAEAKEKENEIRRESHKPYWTQAQLHEMAASKRAETRMRVAYAPEATPDILKFLSGRRRNVQVRRIVAAHPRISPDLLWALADDEDLEVLQTVALHESSPADLLAHLAGRSVDLALLVAMNPDAPAEVLEALTGDNEPLVQLVSTVVRADRALSDGTVHVPPLVLDNGSETD